MDLPSQIRFENLCVTERNACRICVAIAKQPRLHHKSGASDRNIPDSHQERATPQSIPANAASSLLKMGLDVLSLLDEPRDGKRKEGTPIEEGTDAAPDLEQIA